MKRVVYLIVPGCSIVLPLSGQVLTYVVTVTFIRPRGRLALVLARFRL